MSATCGGCERRWTSATEAHCAACHRHFGGVRGFDLHHPGRCADPGTVQNRAGDPLLRLVERVDGPVWLTAGTRTREAT